MSMPDSSMPSITRPGGDLGQITLPSHRKRPGHREASWETALYRLFLIRVSYLFVYTTVLSTQALSMDLVQF